MKKGLQLGWGHIACTFLSKKPKKYGTQFEAIKYAGAKL